MDPTDLGPGTATWLGGTGTVLLGGFIWLRKFLSKDATDRAMDNADMGTVRRLNDLLDSERTARDKALVDDGKNLASAKRRPDSYGRQASHGSMERSILAARLLRFW